jgi:hypothetical protein
VRNLVRLSPAERKLYEDARLAALAKIAGLARPDEKRFHVLAALTRLRLLACHPRLEEPESAVPSSKLARALELIDELRESGHRALVFSQFTRHLALVREALDERKVSYQYLDGSVPEAERRRRVDAFQAGESDLFLISLKAGGTGLNLTAADYVLHLDPWWNPAVEDQATDRAHRIGQTRPVTVYRLVAAGTIEEAIVALHEQKRELAEAVLDGGGAAAGSRRGAVGSSGREAAAPMRRRRDEAAAPRRLLRPSQGSFRSHVALKEDGSSSFRVTASKLAARAKPSTSSARLRLTVRRRLPLRACALLAFAVEHPHALGERAELALATAPPGLRGGGPLLDLLIAPERVLARAQRPEPELARGVGERAGPSAPSVTSVTCPGGARERFCGSTAWKVASKRVLRHRRPRVGTPASRSRTASAPISMNVPGSAGAAGHRTGARRAASG